MSVSNTACTFSNAICSLGSPLPARCSFLIRNKRSSVCARSANASSRLISSASRTGSTDQMLMAIFIYDSHNIQPKVFMQQCIFMSIIKNIEVRWKKQNSFRNIALTSSINMDHIFVFEASYNVYNCVWKDHMIKEKTNINLIFMSTITSNKGVRYKYIWNTIRSYLYSISFCWLTTLPNTCKKLITQPFSCRCTFDKSCNVNKLHYGGYFFRWFV